MAKQTIGLTERQTQRQKQRLTPLQLLIGQMIEKPIDQLTDYVNQQLIDNPALEAKSGDEDWESAEPATPQEGDYDSNPNNDMGDYDNDELPVYEQRERQDPSNTISFYDNLREQMGETPLTDHQRQIMEYLIGSLDNDGLLRKDLTTINDEMAIYHNVYTTDEEIAEVLHQLQQFDPAGIGAQSLQQCLLL